MHFNKSKCTICFLYIFFFDSFDSFLPVIFPAFRLEILFLKLVLSLNMTVNTRKNGDFDQIGKKSVQIGKDFTDLTSLGQILGISLNFLN